MKLLRYGEPGFEKPGLMDNSGNLRDLSPIISDLSDSALSPTSLAALAKLNIHNLAIIDSKVRLGPCVGKSGKFICIGLNYRDHAEETGIEIPKEPVLFAKYTSAISGPYDPIFIPKGSEKTDWEVELGVIIGSKAKYVSVSNALDYVAGYCVINDVSERNFQLERGGGQWTKGKSCDSFAPLGPWLVTKDEIPDPQGLDLWLTVDGHRYQNSSTRYMIFSVAYLIAYLSQFFTLYPGDIISTGTPAGVGLGQKPCPIYLKPGQTVRLGITGLGEQAQITKAEV